MEWYYTQNDTQSGPVTQDQLAEMIRNGSVLPEELAWREGMDDWEAINQIDTFKRSVPAPPSRSAATSSAPPGSAQAGAQRGVVNPYQRPGQGGTRPQVNRRPPQIPNGLVPAILATILCCPIPGIVGIVYAAQVSGHLQRGDIGRAQQSANSAKTWTWIAFGLGLFAVLIQVLIGFSSV